LQGLRNCDQTGHPVRRGSHYPPPFILAYPISLPPDTDKPLKEQYFRTIADLIIDVNRAFLMLPALLIAPVPVSAALNLCHPGRVFPSRKSASGRDSRCHRLHWPRNRSI